MWKLKATHKGLYKLVAKYEELPDLEKTEFYPLYSPADAMLNWKDAGGIDCMAIITDYMGRVQLVIEKQRFFGNAAYRAEHHPKLDELWEVGLVEDPEMLFEQLGVSSAELSAAWDAVVLTTKELVEGLKTIWGKVENALTTDLQLYQALRWAEKRDRPLAHRYHHAKKKRIRKKYAKRILAEYLAKTAICRGGCLKNYADPSLFCGECSLRDDAPTF